MRAIFRPYSTAVPDCVALLLTAGAVGPHDLWITTVREPSGAVRARPDQREE